MNKRRKKIIENYEYLQKSDHGDIETAFMLRGKYIDLDIYQTILEHSDLKGKKLTYEWVHDLVNVSKQYVAMRTKTLYTLGVLTHDIIKDKFKGGKSKAQTLEIWKKNFEWELKKPESDMKKFWEQAPNLKSYIMELAVKIKQLKGELA